MRLSSRNRATSGDRRKRPRRWRCGFAGGPGRDPAVLFVCCLFWDKRIVLMREETCFG